MHLTIIIFVFLVVWSLSKTTRWLGSPVGHTFQGWVRNLRSALLTAVIFVNPCHSDTGIRIKFGICWSYSLWKIGVARTRELVFIMRFCGLDSEDSCSNEKLVDKKQVGGSRNWTRGCGAIRPVMFITVWKRIFRESLKNSGVPGS